MWPFVGVFPVSFEGKDVKVAISMRRLLAVWRRAPVFPSGIKVFTTDQTINALTLSSRLSFRALRHSLGEDAGSAIASLHASFVEHAN